MKEIFSYTKLFTILLALFYIFGLVARFYNLEIIFSIFAFILLAISILLLNLDFKKSLILCFIFILGVIRAENSLNLPFVLDDINSNNAIIKGQIISNKSISTKNNKLKFYIKANNAIIDNKTFDNLDTKIIVNIDDLAQKITIGNYVELKGKLRYPKPATNPFQFDYKQYLLNNDTKNILYADEIKITKTLNFSSNWKDNWYLILQKFDNTRNNIIEKHSKNIHSPKLEILGGIVFGNETVNPDENIKESFKNSGLLHLLAASGLNVALIYGIWWWIANLFRFPYHLSIFTGAIFVVLYTFMTGFPPSILRAATMLLFVLFGKLIDRNANSLALVFFVGFLMLLFSPKMLFDIGFQLSFIVTIGLIVCCPVIIAKFEKLDKKFKEKYKNLSRFQKYFIFLFSPSALASVVAIPLVAQLFVIPLQMHYFNSFTPFSVLANIAVIPFIGILSFIGFIGSIFALVPTLNEPIIYIFDFIANPLLDLLINISNFFSSFKYSLVSTIGLNVFQIFSIWIILFILTLNIKYDFKNKKQLISLILCIAIFICSFMRFDYFKNNLEIVMFDVENADSFLIKTPKNKYIMIDTGKITYKSSNSATIILNKYLKNKQIKTFEKLIITHFDSDHCGGVIDILKNIKVKEIIIQNETAKSQISKDILKYLKENNLNYKIAKNNDEIYFEKDLTIKTFIPSGQTSNENSIATLLKFKNKNILFLADIDAKSFKTIENYFNQKIDVLKIGHHGAKNSVDEKMIKKLKPNYALISAGGTTFNHPHFSTINLLNENNIKTIPTKYFGFVKIVLKNNEIKFYYFDKENKKLKLMNFPQKPKIPFSESEFMKTFI